MTVAASRRVLFDSSLLLLPKRPKSPGLPKHGVVFHHQEHLPKQDALELALSTIGSRRSQRLPARAGYRASCCSNLSPRGAARTKKPPSTLLASTNHPIRSTNPKTGTPPETTRPIHQPESRWLDHGLHAPHASPKAFTCCVAVGSELSLVRRPPTNTLPTHPPKWVGRDLQGLTR